MKEDKYTKRLAKNQVYGDDFQNAVADKGLELERRRLRAKSNVKIFVAMQDDAAANRSLSVCI